MKPRVVITAVEWISPLGHEHTDIVQNLRAGTNVFTSFVPEIFPELSALSCATLKSDPLTLLGGTGWRHFTRSSLMACWTSRTLVARHFTPPHAPDFDLVGVVFAYNHDLYVPSFVSAVQEHDLRILPPPLFLNLSTNAPASHISILNKFYGPIFTVTTGFIGGLEALHIGQGLLQGGYAQTVLAGAAQEASEEVVEAMARLPRVAEGELPPPTLTLEAEHAVRMGEGCALVCLETEERAAQSAHPVLAALLGYGQGFNPQATLSGEPHATLRAIHQAFKAANLTPQDIDCVFLAANGDAVLDAAEVRALQNVFGSHVPPAVALKGSCGESYHAGGASAIAAAVLCLNAGFLPPTLNLHPKAAAETLGLSDRMRLLTPRTALVLALDRDLKAAAWILGFPVKG